MGSKWNKEISYYSKIISNTGRPKSQGTKGEGAPHISWEGLGGPGPIPMDRSSRIRDPHQMTASPSLHKVGREHCTARVQPKPHLKALL